MLRKGVNSVEITHQIYLIIGFESNEFGE